MSDQGSLLLSVRGEARQTVPPDYAVLSATLAVTRDSKAQALSASAAALDRVTAGLAALGGVTLGPDTGRQPLTWSGRSAGTHPEHRHNPETGQREPTGQVRATVSIAITVRDFGLLDRVGASLAAHEDLSVHAVSWDVDWDNPAWPQVRAAAIQAAIGKGRDYAAALGGSLRSVEHIADAGLLGGTDTPAGFTTVGRAARTASLAAESDTPSLDPVPQELTAIIDARLTADGVSVSGRFRAFAQAAMPESTPGYAS
ncbi:MAG: SIMPL domain-containing protein [Actinobacteria bacterium]|nr:SIMPL domain-containing protein [Actinomycetota bacterium]